MSAGRGVRRAAAGRAWAAVLAFATAALDPGTSQAGGAGSLVNPAAVSATPAEASPSGGIVWMAHTGHATDGTPLPGELGRLRVPERWNDATGDSIEIAFVRFKTDLPNPGPPVFFLAGGPGGSGAEGAALAASHPRIRLLEHADVVDIEQRGTGLSRPNLSRPEFPYRLPYDRPLDRASEAAAFAHAAQAGAAYWRARGVDLSAYTTAESVEDIEAVRLALGAERVVLFASSYGTHLALAYLRRHPDRVARAVLSKVEGPDQTWKLPGTVQDLLNALHGRVAADPSLRERLPDVIGLVERLLRGLTDAPVSVSLREGTPDSVTVRVGAYDLRRALAHALADIERLEGIPAALDAMAAGDWSWLAEAAVEARAGSVHSMMAVAMDCASGASGTRRVRISREAADSRMLLRDALDAPFYPETCRSCGIPELGASFRGPFVCDVPILFVSGTLDARTPPANVEAMRSWFPRSAHVVVDGAGHEARELLSEEFREIMQGFLRGEPIADCALTLPFLFDPLPAERAAGD